MIHIQKGDEPDCISQLQSTPGADWSSVHGDQKEKMRESLCIEQGYLCAYCQSRIFPSHQPSGAAAPKEKVAKVEHWEPRNTGSGFFDWSNLLGVCQGKIEGEQPLHHCDTYRGNQSVGQQKLNCNPSAPNAKTLLSAIRYKGSGEIWSEKEELQNDIQTLNLNVWRLKQNRKEIIDRVMSDTNGKSVNDIEKLERMVQSPGADGMRREYAGVALYHLRKVRKHREALKQTGRR